MVHCVHYIMRLGGQGSAFRDIMAAETLCDIHMINGLIRSSEDERDAKEK